jgi:hypothetical protein
VTGAIAPTGASDFRPATLQKLGAEGLAALTPSAPFLPNTPDSQVLPREIQSLPPMARHLWYFKAASLSAQTRTPLEGVQVNPQDHYLTGDDLKTGLAALGVSGPVLDLVSLGVLVDRGGRQLLHQQGAAGKMDIGPGAEWSTAHPSSARSGVYDAQGNIDPQREQHFLDLLDPKNTDHITVEDFSRAGKQIVQANDPGPLQFFKRAMDEGTFDRAWKSFMLVAGHTDLQSGLKYVTRDDVKWFFDGTYFYRRAEQERPAPQPR